jgi:hypothetical protein
MLIPDTMDPASSAGEKLIFYKFRNEKQTNSWYVLHSLFITRHIRNVSGEIDFLLLVPGQGIFCLEVKHGHVSRDGGTWTFTNRAGQKNTSTKGPFRQVSDTMHSLRNWLIQNSVHRPELHKQIKQLMFGWGVLFTSLDYFSDYGSEAEPWQVCTNQIKYIQVSDFITSLSRGWHEKNAGQYWYNETLSRPTAHTCGEIVSLLRGDFAYNYREINRITDQETVITEFTREQFDLLDFTSYNDRCLIEGPAGTGKTILAEELLNRKCREGKRTALICFNRLLGQKIAANAQALVSDTGTPYYAGTLHACMVQRVGGETKETQEYFSETLPLEFLIHMDGRPESEKFDYLIIDEAQDLLTDNYLDVLDAMLRGGLRDGSWCCFGDFTGQAIYLNDPEKAKTLLGSRALFAKHPPLRINCRNTRRIADQNTLLTGVARARLNATLPEGDPVGLFYVSREKVAAKTEEVLRGLVSQKVPLAKITILSAHRREESYLDSQYLNQKIKEGLEIHTIHSFKGLENSVIILTGFASLPEEAFRRLLYVGISRARVKLFLILEQEQETVFQKLIAANYPLLTA